MMTFLIKFVVRIQAALKTLSSEVHRVARGRKLLKFARKFEKRLPPKFPTIYFCVCELKLFLVKIDECFSIF